jgi:hypothetical protein
MARKEKKSKKPHLRARLVFLYIGSFIAFSAPLAICFILRRKEYIKAPADTVKLALGGVLLAVIIAFMILGRLKIHRRIVGLGISFILVYLLQAVLVDLDLLLGLALIGEVLDLILFQGAIKSTKEKILITKTADATSEQVEEVLKKYIGRV